MLYWICLVIGGGMLLFSLFGHDTDTGGDHPGWGETLSWLSVRSVIAAVAFFGLGGVVGGWIGLGGLRLLLFALTAGVIVGGITGWLFNLARRKELNTRVGAVVGRTGTVLVPPGDGRPGQVRVQIAGQSTVLLATSTDTLSVGEQIVVIAEERGVLDVRRWEGLP